MHILMLTNWYPPEPTPLIQQLAEGLRAAGNEVTVITGYPNYPAGRFYEGYRLLMRPPQENVGGVRVLRVPLYPSRSMAPVLRILSYLSFALSACILGLIRVKRVDVVWAYQPPPTIAIPALIARRLHRCPVVYEIQDMWPETLTASGVMDRGFVTRCVESLMAAVYARVDAIRVITPGFVRLLAEKGVDSGKIHYLPNWAAEAAPAPQARYRTDKPFHVLYAGNLGPAQQLDVVVDAFISLAEEHGSQAPTLTFLGDGPMEQALRELVAEQGVANVRFRGRVPSDQVSQFAAEADALLVHLADEPIFHDTIPSKLLTYLSMGRPVLAGLRGDGAAIVSGADCGVVFAPGSPAAARQAIVLLASIGPEERNRMGSEARQVYERDFTKDRIIGEYAEVFQTVMLRMRGPGHRSRRC